jgi:ABC-type proline/glycine betaine transport system permease subunit
LAGPLRRQLTDFGGTHRALIGILVLVGIVLAIPLGIALRVRSRNRRAVVEYVASR